MNLFAGHFLDSAARTQSCVRLGLCAWILRSGLTRYGQRRERPLQSRSERPQVIFLVLQTAVGPTQIEIADHPLRPGDRCDVYLGQGGRGMFRRIALSLELEELATFRQGTDTRTERVVVWRAPLGSWRGLQLAPGTRFEGRGVFQVPATAMHSFISEHYAVSWRVIVRGRPGRWPAFTRSFPVLIYPAAPPATEPTAGRRLP